jgi:hypothetical protein
MDVYQRRRLVALSAIAGVFIVFVLLIRSCGGDDETASTTAAGVSGASGVAGATLLSQTDFVASADPICLESNTSLADVDESDPVQADTDKAQILAGEVQQLQTLGQPTDGTDKLDKFLSSLQKQATAYQDRSTAADRGDDTAVADLDATIDKEAADAADAADAFGFKVCGDPSKVGRSTGGGSDTATSDTSSSDTSGGTATPTTPVAPATTTTPVPVAPPTDEGGTVTPAPAPAPAPAPTDGGTGSSSGGVSP